MAVATAVALLLPLPLHEMHPLPKEPASIIVVQGNSLLATNEPLSVNTHTYSVLAPGWDFVVSEIKKYDWPIETALKIAKCESGYNPNAVNWNDAKITGMPSMGVFQLNRPYDLKYFDYKYNIAEAYLLWQRRGFSPWSCARLTNY